MNRDTGNKNTKAKMSNTLIDITEDKEYEKYLYKCLTPMPFRKYKNRLEYLQCSIPKGFRKKMLFWNKKVVGTIEYAPNESSGLPIFGNDIYVMNCIWVLRKAKGHNFGKVLINDAVQEIKNMNAKGLATISLENYPSPWLRKEQMDKLSFKTIDSIELKITHKEKYKGRSFKIYLMFLPIGNVVKMPTWDTEKLLNGVTFCMAHPLYHPQSIKQEQIFKKEEDRRE